MEIGKVDCELTISVDVDCPNEDCGNSFNLFDLEHLTDEGTIHRAVLGETFGTDDFDEIVQCPDCGILMKIGAITWRG